MADLKYCPACLDKWTWVPEANLVEAERKFRRKYWTPMHDSCRKALEAINAG